VKHKITLLAFASVLFALCACDGKEQASAKATPTADSASLPPPAQPSADLVAAVPHAAANVGVRQSLLHHTYRATKALRQVDTQIPASWKPVLSIGELSKVTAVRAGTTPADLSREAQWWCQGAVERWNEIARDSVATYHLNSSYSSRLFAALAVGQYDALLRARSESVRAGTASGDSTKLLERGCGDVERINSVSQEAAIAYASARILAAHFSRHGNYFIQNANAHSSVREWMGANTDAELNAGRAIGEAVAKVVLARLETDGAREANGPPVAQQPGKWWGPDQILPEWRRVKPWVMERADQFRAPPPPAIDSNEFKALVKEIRTFSDQRSAEQLSIAQFWNLGVGGISVPGMWDQILFEYANEKRLGESTLARMSMTMNLAMHDALLASWESKFHYLVPRPSMVDSNISTPVGVPAHPAYTSGHSAFSGAAGLLLGIYFPERKDVFHAMAEEASASRFYGGIHYRIDGDEGLKQGRGVAELAIKMYPLD
jgi:hypothetical protein